MRVRVAKKVGNVHAWAIGTYDLGTLRRAFRRLNQVRGDVRWQRHSSRLDRLMGRRERRAAEKH